MKSVPKYATYFYTADAKYAPYVDSKYATFLRKIYAGVPLTTHRDSEIRGILRYFTIGALEDLG